MKEFDDERAAIANQISSIHGFQVSASELWGAISDSAEKVYLGGVRECHIYIGLFGHVYSAATRDEYEEACQNPYRQKLIYLKPAKKIDPDLAELIALFQRRHRPYTFKDLWDLLPRVMRDLDRAVDEILNQVLERNTLPPVAQSGAEASVSLQAWKNKQEYLAALYQGDTDLTIDHLRMIRTFVG